MLAKYVESDEFEKCPKPQTMISAFVQRDFWAPGLLCVNLSTWSTYPWSGIMGVTRETTIILEPNA